MTAVRSNIDDACTIGSIPATTRVARLRQRALSFVCSGARSDEGELLWLRGWIQHGDVSSQLLRRAKARAWQLENTTPVIEEDELLVGRPCYRTLNASEQQELEDGHRMMAAILPRTGGQGSHMAIDYEKLLRLGISGLLNEIKTRRQSLDLDDPGSLAREQFYQACTTTLQGLAAMARRYAAAAENLSTMTADPIRRQEYAAIASLCAQVPFYPARTFREALQSIHFVTSCLEGLYQYGRPDRYLLAYYDHDRAAGVLTEAEAQELIDCLCIQLNMFTAKGLAVGLMVGGCDAEGRDICNDLTRLFLQSIDHTRMAYPGIGLCYTEDTPQEILELSCRLLGKGLTHPALFNDAVITRGLRHYGLPPEEACLYIHSTCVEITPIASSAVWVASPYINLLQLLLDVMADPHQMMPAGEQTQDHALESARETVSGMTFTDLLFAWRRHLRESIRHEIQAQNVLQMERERHGGDPLVSCFVCDCLANGLDIDQGGARYNWIMPSFIGLANLADSLLALRRLVFEDKRFSLAEMTQILADNFRYHERLRQEIISRIPKYGNDDDEADDIVLQITGWILKETEPLRTWRGDRIVPSLFCWIMHERFGSQTGASPDGRVCGFPLGDGSGPAQGREQKGPTASILSSTKWVHDWFIGGIAVNLKFSSQTFNDTSRAKMLDLIRTYMARGGFELQINTVDRDTLLQARQHPEPYRDLVVRVGGYSDYFVRLTPAMQDEVILRSEHDL